MHDDEQDSEIIPDLGGIDAGDAQLRALAYSSDELHVAEADKIFARQWICAGHVAMLPKVGDYFTIDLVGNLLVAVRAQDRIRVLSRVCLHRWASVVEGTGSTRRFTCPFHSWSYGLDGSLLAAAFMDKAEGFDRSACHLPEVRAEILDDTGLIFISLSQDADGRTDLPDAVLASHLGGGVAAGPFREEKIKRNWKSIIEEHVAAPGWLVVLPNLLIKLEGDAASLLILYPNGPNETITRSVMLLGTCEQSVDASPLHASVMRYVEDCLAGR